MWDVLIAGGMVYDGTLRPGRRANVAIADRYIAHVGDEDGPARLRVEADGLAVAPGFIDAHSHSDLAALVCPDLPSKVRQGVTTEVIGQCGISAAPLVGAARAQAERRVKEWKVDLDWEDLEGFRRAVKRQGVAANLACLVGHGNLRLAVLGPEDRSPNDTELARMQQLLAEGMQQGAFGMSTGLIYPPGCYSRTPELEALARVLADYGGVYVTHLRSEGDGLLEALEEAITVGRSAGVRVCISHHKAAGKPHWGKTRQTLRRMEEACEEGGEIFCDVYPYTAGSTSLGALVPSWAHSGGMEQMLRRLADPEQRVILKRQMAEGIPGWENLGGMAGYDNVLITRTRSPANRQAVGMTVAEWAARKGVDPRDAIFDLLLEERGAVGVVLFMMDEEDVRRVIAHPLSVIGSDASAVDPDQAEGSKPHPRAYGTFPRVLARYVREEGLLSWEEAIHKMTWGTARRLGLRGRGRLRRGDCADVVVFDPARVADLATYTEPHQFPTGIIHVFVNGTAVVFDGQPTGARPGEVLDSRQGRP